MIMITVDMDWRTATIELDTVGGHVDSGSIRALTRQGWTHSRAGRGLGLWYGPALELEDVLAAMQAASFGKIPVEIDAQGLWEEEEISLEDLLRIILIENAGGAE